MKLKKIVKHFKLITYHKWIVFKLCCKIGEPWRGFMHDFSKYSPTEFWESAKYYVGDHSPIIEAKKDKGYSEAWLHHKGRNKHHWEFWVDFTRKGVIAAKMPNRYVVEMFCDRVAASLIYRGKDYKDSDPIDYYNGGKDSYIMHPQTRELLESLLIYLKENGLDKTVSYIKNNFEY